MTSRRALLLGTGLMFAKASQPLTRLNFEVPRGACDCHTHIFADPAKFPWAKERSYTPEPALPEEMRRLHRALHVDRVVIVNPSVYGIDNAATLHGIRTLGLQRARGIAVVSPDASTRELQDLDRGGCCGIRLNFATGPAPDAEAMRVRLKKAVAQVKPLDWHIQIYTNMAGLNALGAAILECAPVPVVLDHGAGAKTTEDVAPLIRLLQAGHVYVKVTHRFLSTGRGPAYKDTEPLAKALFAARPDRILWGTDWPHPNSTSTRKATEVSPLEAIDDGAMFNLWASWAGDAKTMRRILVENPAHLYRF